jgi:hypothetical protein
MLKSGMAKTGALHPSMSMLRSAAGSSAHRHGLQNMLLVRMVEMEIIFMRPTAIHASREHAGMFAGTIVVQNRGPFAAPFQLSDHRGAERLMNAAVQILRPAADFSQNAGDGVDMLGFATVAGHHHRHFVIAKAKISGTASS